MGKTNRQKLKAAAAPDETPGEPSTEKVQSLLGDASPTGLSLLTPLQFGDKELDGSRKHLSELQAEVAAGAATSSSFALTFASDTCSNSDKLLLERQASNSSSSSYTFANCTSPSKERNELQLGERGHMLEECKRENSKLKKLLAESCEQRLALQTQVEQRGADLRDDRELVLEESMREIQSLKSLLAEASEQRLTLEAKVEQQDAKIKMYTDQVQSMSSMRAEVMNQVTTMQSFIKAKDNQLADCRREIESLQAREEQNHSHAADCHARSLDSEARLEERDAELEEVTTELESLRSIHAINCNFGATLEAQARERELKLDEYTFEIVELKSLRVADAENHAIMLKEAFAEKCQLEERERFAQQDLEDYRVDFHQKLCEDMVAMQKSHQASKASWKAHLLRDAHRAERDTLCACWSAWRQEGVLGYQERRHARLQFALGSKLVNTHEAAHMEVVLKMCWLAWCNVGQRHILGFALQRQASPGISASPGIAAPGISPSIAAPGITPSRNSQGSSGFPITARPKEGSFSPRFPTMSAKSLPRSPSASGSLPLSSKAMDTSPGSLSVSPRKASLHSKTSYGTPVRQTSETRRQFPPSFRSPLQQPPPPTSDNRVINRGKDPYVLHRCVGTPPNAAYTGSPS